MPPSSDPRPVYRLRVSPVGVGTALAGTALLVWVIAALGPAAIAADVRHVGWGIAAIVALGGLRFLLRAAAWQMCLDPPNALRLRDAFAASARSK